MSPAPLIQTAHLDLPRRALHIASLDASTRPPDMLPTCSRAGVVASSTLPFRNVTPAPSTRLNCTSLDAHLDASRVTPAPESPQLHAEGDRLERRDSKPIPGFLCQGWEPLEARVLLDLDSIPIQKPPKVHLLPSVEHATTLAPLVGESPGIDIFDGLIKIPHKRLTREALGLFLGAFFVPSTSPQTPRRLPASKVSKVSRKTTSESARVARAGGGWGDLSSSTPRGSRGL